MRDIALTVFLMGCVPFVLRRPFIGVLLFAWIGIGAPHRMVYGFALDIPWAALMVAVTFVGLITGTAQKHFPKQSPIVIMILLFLWMCVTTLFAMFPDGAYFQLNRVFKVQLMILVTMMLTYDRRQLDWLVWVITGSIGYFGLKGGLFTITTGGNFMIWGREGTWIGGNNEIALALLMMIPLMRYVQLTNDNKWIRRFMLALMGLSALAALSSYSRGALLGLACMGIFLWLKSRQKVAITVFMVLLIPLLLAFMPEKWQERMSSIQTYDQDASAQGRLNAWYMAINLAVDHPFVGGGFDVTQPAAFARYAPNPADIHAAHSIFLQMLGEHGFVGLGLFLLLGMSAWRTGNWIIRQSRDHPDYRWAHDLATMVQVSLIGFASGGAFLSLAYWDVPYYLVVVLVVARSIMERELKVKHFASEEIEATGFGAAVVAPSQHARRSNIG